MKPANIDSVRRFAKTAGARGCIVIVIDDEQFGWTSYGRNRKDCDTMRQFMEVLFYPVDNGEIDPWNPSRKR